MAKIAGCDGILQRRYEDLERKQEWRQLVVSQSLREVMEELHAGVMGGQVGESKTLQQLKCRYYWLGHSLDVKGWCQTCPICEATQFGYLILLWKRVNQRNSIILGKDTTMC